MKVIALYSIKGGVGKTASAVNLAHLAAKEGSSVLLCDLDPQGASTFYLRIRPSDKHGAKPLIKGGKQVEKAIRGTDYKNLDLLPAAMSYRQLDIELDARKRSRKRLKETLAQFKGEYDYIFLDCPPNLTLLSENIFEAADIILTPMIPTTLSVLTYDKLVAFFKEEKLQNKKIYAFMTLYEKRKKLHRDTIEECHKKNKRFLKTNIPFSSHIEKMGVEREPVACFAGRSAGAKAYKSLWQEVETKLL